MIETLTRQFFMIKNLLIDRLRSKEEAINDWELHQTMKAMDHMDKIQACNFIIYMHACMHHGHKNEADFKHHF
jgi:hypothetical protein